MRLTMIPTMKLVIFDVDGVLEKDEILLAERAKYQLKEIAKKYDVSLSDAEALFKKAKESLPEKKKKTTVYAIEKLGFSRKEYFDMINAVDPEGLIEPYPGCKEVLEELSSKHILVAFSNTPRKALMKTLRILDVVNYFKKIYTAEDFIESKPSPSIIKHIMADQKKAGKDTISIGNSLEKDVAPSKEAGTLTVLFDGESNHIKKPKDADYMIHDLKELKNILRMTSSRTA